MDGAHHHDAHHLYGGTDPHSDIALAQNAHLMGNPDMAEELAKEYAQITKIFSSPDGQLVHEEHEQHHAHEQQEGHIHQDQSEQQMENQLAEGQSLEHNIQLDPGLEFPGPGIATGSPAVSGICIVKECNNPTRPRGKLCAMHQKRRDRKQPLEFKDPGFGIKKGRPPLPFSKSNRRKKLKHLDDVLNKYAGGRDEGTKLLKEYLESSHCTRRFAEDNSKAFDQIGKNLVSFIKEMPPASPFKPPLIQAVANGLTARELKDLLGVSESTIARGKTLTKEDNLLLSMTLKPISGKNVSADLLEALM